MKYSLAILAFVIATAIAFFDPRTLLKTPGTTTPRAIAKITAIEGEISLRRPRSTQIRILHPESHSKNSNENLAEDSNGGTNLGAQEIVTTSPDASTTLEFAGGWRLKLQGNSRLAADFDAGSSRINITLLVGEIEILNAGEADAVQITKDGRVLSASGSGRDRMPVIGAGRAAPGSSLPRGGGGVSTDGEPPISLATDDEETSDPSSSSNDLPARTTAKPGVLPRSLPSKRADPSAGLSDAEISRSLASQGSRFQRCFLGYINRTGNKQATGVVFVAFEVGTNGKTDGARLVTSPFDDDTLHTCLLEVVNRTPFKQFDGDPVRIDRFPIAFE